MRIRTLMALMAALATLSACGDAASDLDVAREAIEVLRIQRGDPPPDARGLVTPETLAEVPTALFTERPGVNGAQSIMFLQVTNRGAETWQDTVGVTAILRDGVMVGTRGFGGDLMSADASDAVAAIRGGGAQAVRVHRWLDGEDQLALKSYVCNYRRGTGPMTDPLVAGRSARIVVEDCVDSEGEGFENRYWIDSGGVIRQSEQWIGPDQGLLTIVRLKG